MKQKRDVHLLVPARLLKVKKLGHEVPQLLAHFFVSHEVEPLEVSAIVVMNTVQTYHRLVPRIFSLVRYIPEDTQRPALSERIEACSK